MAVMQTTTANEEKRPGAMPGLKRRGKVSRRGEWRNLASVVKWAGQAGTDAAQQWFADLKESVTLAAGVAGHDVSSPQGVQHQATLGVLSDIERRTRLEIAGSRRP